MCSPSELSRGSKTSPRPAWSGLYARAGLMLSAMLLAQALVATGPERTGLQCVLVLGGFVAMVQWTHRNRAALDHLDWCDCASSRVTLRVIPSGRGQLARAEGVREPALVDAEAVEANLEEVAR